MKTTLKGLGSAAVLFGTFDAKIYLNAVKAVDRIGAKVEKKAKAKLGEYQDGNGAHEAWDELAPMTKSQRVRLGYTENDPGLRSGKMRKSISHVSHELTTTIGSDDDNLVYFEHGTKKQPPRSVLGAAAYESIDAIKKEFGDAVIGGMLGEGSITKI